MRQYVIKITLHHRHRGDWHYFITSDAHPAYGPEEPAVIFVDYDYFISDIYEEGSGGPFAGDDPALKPDFRLKMEESGPLLVSTQSPHFIDSQPVRNATSLEIALGVPSRHSFILKNERYTIETNWD